MSQNNMNAFDDQAVGEEIKTVSNTAEMEKQSDLPDGIPEKFWDSTTGTIRVEAMAKSYQELERKLGESDAAGVPDSPDGYAVTINGESYETDAEVNLRLHSAGFSQDQVQMVYELANEKLKPIMDSMTNSYEAENQIERLKAHFGSDQKWTEAKRRITAWGRENFTDDVYEALSSTYEGVLTMQRMMSSNEPEIGKASSGDHGPDESALRAMMRDPRYWRERNPAYIEQVRRGFRSLYPGD
ncbi:MAG: hypothetical protein H8D75_00025 [Rhodospirillaceae bacterium]|nr:hypothetical protein [Rhodospirillaceae bacterium]MBL6932917.1 hypothetical protein [Rhodospirillales bacterium]